MDDWANFKGARILGYCLHVLGLTVVDRHTGHGKEFYPLHLMALRWVKANFRKLLADHPQVAFAVFVEYGQYGGQVAWPIVHDALAACIKEGYLK